MAHLSTQKMSHLSTLWLRGAAAEEGLVELSREEQLCKMLLEDLDWYGRITSLIMDIVYKNIKRMKEEERDLLLLIFDRIIVTSTVLGDFLYWLDANKSGGNEESVIKGHRLRTEDDLIFNVWNKLSTSAVMECFFEFVKEPLQRHTTTTHPLNNDYQFAVTESSFDSSFDVSSLLAITKKISSSSPGEADGSSSGSSTKSPETITKKRKYEEDCPTSGNKSPCDEYDDEYKAILEDWERYKDEDDDFESQDRSLT